MRGFESLDLLIASMIAESGEPDEQAEAWAEAAMSATRQAQNVTKGEHASPAR